MKFIALLAILAVAFVVAHAQADTDRPAKVSAPAPTEKAAPTEKVAPTKKVAPGPKVFSALGNEANYQVFGKTVSSKSFSVAFSAQASNDVHVAFMCGKNARTTKAYEVVIGGWGNSRSVIRRGTQGHELASAAGARASANKMAAYWISYEAGTISVWQQNADEADPAFMSAKAARLPCDELTVAFGGWNSPVHFSKVSYEGDEDYSPARPKKEVLAAQIKKLLSSVRPPLMPRPPRRKTSAMSCVRSKPRLSSGPKPPPRPPRPLRKTPPRPSLP